MAEIKQGILGAVNGKVGTVVGVMWRKRNIIRSKPSRSKKKPSAKQLLQWDKMSLVSTFASKFKDFVNAHCPSIFNGKKWQIGKEQMISRLMTQGISLINGEQHIKVEEVLLSIGTLAPAVIKKINRLKTGKYKVQWDNTLVNALTLDTDSLTMMVYNETLDKFEALADIGNRVDKYAHFSLPKGWDTGRIYFWSMWKAADGSVHSTSCFHGVLELENIEEQQKNKEQKTGNEEQGAENAIPHNPHQVETQSTDTPPIPFNKNVCKTSFSRSVLCHPKHGDKETGNGEQESENREQTTKHADKQTENEKTIQPEVLPIQQAREISFSNFLEQENTTTQGETAPPSKHAVKQGETTPPSKHAVKEGELKKWTPPGYIRKVNKKLITEPSEKSANTNSSKEPKGIIEGARSILEVNNISEELKE